MTGSWWVRLAPRPADAAREPATPWRLWLSTATALLGTLRDRSADILHSARAASEEAAAALLRAMRERSVPIPLAALGRPFASDRQSTSPELGLAARVEFRLAACAPGGRDARVRSAPCARIHRLLRCDHSIRRGAGDRTDTERTRGGGGRRASLCHPRGLQGRQAGSARCAAHPSRKPSSPSKTVTSTNTRVSICHR